jgi:hypothetical protein
MYRKQNYNEDLIETFELILSVYNVLIRPAKKKERRQTTPNLHWQWTLTNCKQHDCPSRVRYYGNNRSAAGASNTAHSR